jgi:hypothetical protein
MSISQRFLAWASNDSEGRPWNLDSDLVEEVKEDGLDMTDWVPPRRFRPVVNMALNALLYLAATLCITTFIQGSAWGITPLHRAWGLAVVPAILGLLALSSWGNSGITMFDCMTLCMALLTGVAPILAHSMVSSIPPDQKLGTVAQLTIIAFRFMPILGIGFVGLSFLLNPPPGYCDCLDEWLWRIKDRRDELEEKPDPAGTNTPE